MRWRVDKFGVAEPMIQTSGEDKIVIKFRAFEQTAMTPAKPSRRWPSWNFARLPQSDDRRKVPNLCLAELMSYDLDGRKITVMTEVAMSGSHIKRACVIAATTHWNA